MDTDQKTDDAETIKKQEVPSTTKKNKSCCMNMSGYGKFASSGLFLLDAYQDRIDIDSDFTMTRMVIGIHRNIQVGGLYQNSEQESLHRGDEV